MAQTTKQTDLDTLLGVIKREAVNMLLAKETGFITLHFDGKCGVRHEINRKGELVQVEMPYQLSGVEQR